MFKKKKEEVKHKVLGQNMMEKPLSFSSSKNKSFVERIKKQREKENMIAKTQQQTNNVSLSVKKTIIESAADMEEEVTASSSEDKTINLCEEKILFVQNPKQETENSNKDEDMFTPFLATPENKTKWEEEIKEFVVRMGIDTGWDEEQILKITTKHGYPAHVVKKIVQSIPPQYKAKDIQEKIRKEKEKQIQEKEKQKQSKKLIGEDGKVIPFWTEKERVFWQGRNMFLYKGKQIRTMDKIISMRKKMGEPKKGLNIYRLFNKGDHYDDYGKKEFDLMYHILDWQSHPDPEKAAIGKTKYDLYLEVPRHPRSKYYYLLPPKKPYPELVQENIMDGKIILGEGTDIHDKQKPITLPIHDLYTHELITGGTGKGKTSILIHQALQLIAAGVNLFVFDPKGELIDGILPHLPESLLQQNRVVIIDPYDTELPVSINPLYIPGLEHLKQTNDIEKIKDLQGRLKENIVDMLKRTMPVEYATPSLDRNLRGITGACLEAGNTTLVDAYYIIKDKGKRWRLLNMLSKETSKYYVASQLSSSRDEDLISTENRLYPFFDDEKLKRMLCKRTNPLDFSSLVAPGMVVLIDLRKAKVTSSIGRILGTVYAIQLWLTVISQKGTVDITKKREQGRFPTIAIMDEFQNFTTESFTEILNEARSYNFGLIMATQYISQIHPKMVDGLIENVALHIALGVGAKDAKILKDVLGCKEKYLTRLDPFTFYGRAKVGAVTTKAFYGELYHPLRKPRNWELFVKLFYEHSKEIYGRVYDPMDTTLFGTDVRQIEDMLKAVHCLQIKNKGKNIFYFDEVQGEMERIATMPNLLRVGSLVGISKSCADQGLMKIDFDNKKAEELTKNEQYRAFRYSITQDGLSKIGVDTKTGRSAAAGGLTHRSLIGAARDLTLLLGGDMIVKNQDEGGTEWLPDAEVHVEPIMDGRTPSQQEKIRSMLIGKPIYDLSGGRDVNWEIESSTVGVREKIVHNFCKGLRENRIVFFGVGSEQDGFRVAGIMDYFIKEGHKTYKISEMKTYERDSLPREPNQGDYQIFVLSDTPMLYDMRTESFKKVKTTTSIGMDMLTFEHTKTLLPILEKIVEEKTGQINIGKDVSDEEKQKTREGPWEIPLQSIYQNLEEIGFSSGITKQDIVNIIKKLGVITLDAPTGHIENTLFTITKENIMGIKNTLEEEAEETSIKKTELKKEYDRILGAKDKIEVQIKKADTDTMVFEDEKDMGIKAGIPNATVHHFLRYGGATKTEDGKITVTIDQLSNIINVYQNLLKSTNLSSGAGVEAQINMKENITEDRMLGLYDEYISKKNIDKAGRIKHNMEAFMVEMGVRKQYNISPSVMEKFNQLLQRHMKQTMGMSMIKKSVKDEINEKLGESVTLKKLKELCDYIKQKKGIMEAGVMGLRKAELNTLLNNNIDNVDVVWNILQERPVPGGVFDTETGEIILSLEQYMGFEKQIPLIAQKHILQEDDEGKEEIEPRVVSVVHEQQVGIVKQCYFCEKELKSPHDFTETKRYGPVCLECFETEKGASSDVADATSKQDENMEGLTNDDKILKVLSNQKDKLFTIKEVSELTKLDYFVVGTTLRRLAEKGLIANPDRGKYCYKEKEEEIKEKEGGEKE